jgi:hypothetical protein
MGNKLGWVKEKKFGLPLGVWALVSAVVILYIYRKHKAATGGGSTNSSTNPNALDSSAAPSGGGGSDNSGALAAIANELAMEEQILSSVLDRLQGKKHHRHKPHRRKHHPKGSRPPRTRKNPVTTKHGHRGKVHKHRHPHTRSSGGGGGRVPVSEAGRRPTRPATHTARSMGVRPGGIRKLGLGIIPKQEISLAHSRGEFAPNLERTPENPDVSFTRGVSTTAKRNPEALPDQTQHRENTHAHHPAFTKARKH